MKNILKFNIEKWLLGNLTRLSFYLILLLLTIQITYYFGGNHFLEIDELITIIGAILAFWYGYKKYERDKELEIIEKYTEKYNSIKKKIYNINGIPDYCDIFNLWYEEYYLYHKGYISEKLWKEWEFWIEDDIKRFIDYEKLMLNDSYIYKQLIDTYGRYNLLNEMSKIKKIKELDFIKVKNQNFYEFIQKVINDEYKSFNEYIGYLALEGENKEFKKIKDEIIYYNKLNNVPGYFKLG